MIYNPNTRIDPYTLQMYEQLFRVAPVNWLTRAEWVWSEDLYFIMGAIPADLFDRYYLHFQDHPPA